MMTSKACCRPSVSSRPSTSSATLKACSAASASSGTYSTSIHNHHQHHQYQYNCHHYHHHQHHHHHHHHHHRYRDTSLTPPAIAGLKGLQIGDHTLNCELCQSQNPGGSMANMDPAAMVSQMMMQNLANPALATASMMQALTMPAITGGMPATLPPPSIPTGPPSTVVLLNNMVTIKELEEEYDDIVVS
jgi:hypothetical protein